MTARRPNPKPKGRQRRCPVEGCPNYHGTDQVLCRGHWFKSPKALRDAVWESYRARDRERSFGAIRSLLNWHAEAVTPASEGGNS